MRTYDVAFSTADGAAHREVLERIHAAWVAGEVPPAQPRRVIRDSWLRARRAGIQPGRQARGPQPLSHPAGEPSIMDALPITRMLLDPLLIDGQALLVLADAGGTVVWRGGGRALLRRADVLGFEPGNSWSERVVGTNAIGTALATRGPVQVHAAEHFCLAHHQWSCAAAPVLDPRTLAPLGAIDLSFLAHEGQSSAIALATSIARQAGLELRDSHRRELARFATAAKVPATGAWALVDRWGWVAACQGMAKVARIRLPRDMASTFLVEGLGVVEASPAAEGWVLAPTGASLADPHEPELRVSAHECELVTWGGGRRSGQRLGGRRADILRCLAERPEGLSGRELAEAVYGRSEAEAAVRAEVCRINRELGQVVLPRPYRLAAGISVVRIG